MNAKQDLLDIIKKGSYGVFLLKATEEEYIDVMNTLKIEEIVIINISVVERIHGDTTNGNGKYSNTIGTTTFYITINIE